MKIQSTLTRAVIVLTMCLFLSPELFAVVEENPKREMRSVWMTALGIDWPIKGKATATAQNEAIGYLDQLKAAGFNCIFLHVRPNADRRYSINSWKDPKTGETYTVWEPTSESVTSSGTRGATLAYDPLKFWIDEAHKRGMELYAWVNPYRWYAASGQSKDLGSTYIPSSRTGDLDKAPMNNGWIIHYAQKQTDGTYTIKYVFNPALDVTNSRVTSVCRVLTGAYDIDGVVFDDYFYPDGIPENDTADDWPQYQAYKNAGGTMSIGNWRRENVNKMVRLVKNAIHDIKPWVKFGISPAGVAYKGVKTSDGIPALSNYCTASDWQYSTIYSDPIAWMREKSVDFISPQLYWKTTHSSNPFGPLSAWWSIAAQKLGVHFYASHSVSYLAGTGLTDANKADMSQQVLLNRQNSVDGGNIGSVYYSTKNVLTGLDKTLKNDRYQYPSATPAITWYDAPDPGLVTNVTLSGSTLKWDAKDNMRYLVYAVPDGLKPENIQSSQGGYLAKYIVDITYTNSLTIPSNRLTGYWYAVAPLDRYGNEWPATTLGLNIILPGVAPDLVSPADKETLTKSTADFVCSDVEADTYTIDISTSSTFGTTVLSTSTGWTDYTSGGKKCKKYSASFADLEDGTYYWRVRVVREGYTDATSAVRSFTIDRILPGVAPELVAPVEKEVIYETDADFVCTDVEADKYTLDISTSNTFATTLVSTSEGWTESIVDGKNCKVNNVSLAGYAEGTYYWRVRVVRKGYKDATSAVQSFTIPHIYNPTREDYVYETIVSNIGDSDDEEHLILTNDWIRFASKDEIPSGDRINLCRDMAIFRADGVASDRDLVLIAERLSGSSTADCTINKYDLQTGEYLGALALTFDNVFVKSYFPNNGIIVDKSNNVLVHNLALASKTSAATVNIAKVDMKTGACTTIFAVKPNGIRVDHMEVYGSTDAGETYYVFVAGADSNSKNCLIRYTVKDGAVLNTVYKNDLSALGTAPQVHAVDPDHFYIDGSSIAPTLYDISGKVIVKHTPDGSTSNGYSANGITTFELGGRKYIVSANFNATEGFYWNVCSADDIIAGQTNLRKLWSVPNGGIGTFKMSGGDFTAPVRYIQTGASDVSSLFGLFRAEVLDEDPVKTTFVVFAPGNGMASYTLTRGIQTGVEDITIEEAAGQDAEYYTLQGIRIEVAKLTPGLYLVRNGNRTYKAIIR